MSGPLKSTSLPLCSPQFSIALSEDRLVKRIATVVDSLTAAITESKSSSTARAEELNSRITSTNQVGEQKLKLVRVGFLCCCTDQLVSAHLTSAPLISPQLSSPPLNSAQLRSSHFSSPQLTSAQLTSAQSAALTTSLRALTTLLLP